MQNYKNVLYSKHTILYSSQAGAPRQTIYGQTAPLFPSEVPNTKYNQKVLANPSFIAKYNSRGGWWMNVRILRYADVVLMYAEAANELGGTANTTLALDALNSIRERARRGAPSGTLPDVVFTSQEQLRDAIRHERRVELAFEGFRFTDLKRLGLGFKRADGNCNCQQY